jgi:hypothetical protein
MGKENVEVKKEKGRRIQSREGRRQRGEGKRKKGEG